MAKSRAQRKAERRAREAAQASTGKSGDAQEVSKAQHDTQVPRSGDIAEIDAVEAGIEAGAPEEDLETPDAPAPARQDRSAKREERKRRKESEKRQLAERKRQEKGEVARKQKQAAADRQRGGVIGFLMSCWAELKKVQWPVRDTLVQATVVTLIFVVIAACLLYTSPSPRDGLLSRMPSSA